MSHLRFALAPLLLALLPAACGERADGAGSSTAEGVAAADTALRRLAAEILPAVEEASGLPARAPLRLGVRTRRGLESFLLGELERQLPPERAEALVRSYARFGLLPDTADLAGLLRSLYLEQVVGYYDPRSDTLFVVEGVAPEQVEIVLSHEMVHGLQDQYMDLDSLMRSLEGRNDRGTAARAALEGHATFAMLEWFLARATGESVDLTAFPDVAELLAANPGALAVGMPALERMPRLVRESLLFPYLGGLSFVQGLWAARPERPVPLGEALPESSEQILHPGLATGTRRDPPRGVEFAEPPPPGWREVWSDDLGELETRILLAEHLGDEAEAEARRAAAGWGGDRYRLLEGPEGELLAWATVWDAEIEATEFESSLRRAYEARYGPGGGRAVRIERTVVDGLPAVTLTDAPGEVPAEETARAVRFRAPGSTGP